MSPDRPLLLVHGTFASQQEIESLAERFGDRLSWVLCPRSNDYIEGARPPVETLRRAGVRIALGTDSLSSNETLSIVEELKMLRSVPLDEALRWATLGGAEALGIDLWAGSFVPGNGREPSCSAASTSVRRPCATMRSAAAFSDEKHTAETLPRDPALFP